MQNLIYAIAFIMKIMWFVFAAVIPAIHVKKTGDVSGGVLRSWKCNIAFSVIMSALIPISLVLLLPNHKIDIENAFLGEEISIVFSLSTIMTVLLMGWLPALIVCGIARIFYKPPQNELRQDIPPAA